MDLAVKQINIRSFVSECVCIFVYVQLVPVVMNDRRREGPNTNDPYIIEMCLYIVCVCVSYSNSS